MARVHYQDRVGLVIKRAMDESGIVRNDNGIRFKWDVSGTCEKPVLVEMYGRPSPRHGVRHVRIAPETKKPLLLELNVPCRKCSSCVKRRRAMWVARACHEYREANRTWMATLTLSPQAHYVMQSRALLHASSRSIPTKEMSPAEVAERQTNETLKEVTKFLKRVRKECGSHTLRYLIVREEHKSGLPHFHALMHERDIEQPIRHEVLSRQWTLGFSKFKLCDDEKAAYYVAKYLTKADGGRVRASIGYGRIAQSPPKAIEERSEACANPTHERSKVCGGEMSQKDPELIEEFGFSETTTE